MLLALVPLFFISCGGSDDDATDSGDDTNNTGSTNSSWITDDGSTANDNANSTTTNTEYGRTEVPRLSSTDARVLTYSTDTYGVNYMVEWDDAKKAQRWSCYVLSQTTLQQNTSRYTPADGESQYLFDTRLPDSAYFSSDPYYGNGQRYEHGHICPSADRLYSAEANKQTFYLTNMQPQFASFNSGVWLVMENAVRNLAERNSYTWCDSLFVVKGGTIDDGQWGGYNKVYQTLSNGLVVPRYFFVALLAKKGNSYNAIGLWFSQVGGNNSDTALAKYAVSIDALEERTGIDFFCNLPDALEQTVESICQPSQWNFK
jgi:endonuclease G